MVAEWDSDGDTDLETVGKSLATWVVQAEARDISDAELGQRLRMGMPAVLGRLRGAKLVLDVRTVFPSQDGLLLEALRTALGGGELLRSDEENGPVRDVSG